MQARPADIDPCRVSGGYHKFTGVRVDLTPQGAVYMLGGTATCEHCHKATGYHELRPGDSYAVRVTVATTAAAPLPESFARYALEAHGLDEVTTARMIYRASSGHGTVRERSGPKLVALEWKGYDEWVGPVFRVSFDAPRTKPDLPGPGSPARREAYIVTDPGGDGDYEHDEDGSVFTRDGAEAFAARLNAGRPEGQDRCIVLPAERPMREVTTPARGSGPVACDSPACRWHRERCLFGQQHTWSTWFDNGRLPRTASTFHCHACGGVCTAEEQPARSAGSARGNQAECQP